MEHTQSAQLQPAATVPPVQLQMAQPQLAAPQPQVHTIQAQVPVGMLGGMTMPVQTPSGIVQVQIPPGLQQGQAFQFQVQTMDIAPQPPLPVAEPPTPMGLPV